MGYGDNSSMWTAIGWGVPGTLLIIAIAFGVWCSYSYQTPPSAKNYEIVLQKVNRLEARTRELEQYLSSLKVVIETRPQVRESIPSEGR